MMFDTANKPRPPGVDDDARACLPDDPVIERARRLQALMGQRSALFPEPVMADDAMAAMLTLFLAQSEGRTVSRASLNGAQDLRSDPQDEVVAALIKAGLVRAGSAGAGGPAVGEGDAITLTPMGSARMRNYLGDHRGIGQ
ncbi:MULTISPECIES: hypothetical protein [unclassified Sphingobium]|uniref:hypothetical protein n=2 Tax=unclassified Sphingobium TaxID=2611147 RepID=UPI002223F21A|nr:MULTISPECIES: hypothetical protein [unclassified Sphingobium]MCW2370264.1 hypothetical protein [Sphingobium sp. B11D3D]MCW2418759.1 hypothetical protein [Sphingobium sp. B8D3C]